MKILVINGPNLNFLGIREKEIYGEENYDSLIERIRKKAEEEGDAVECFQSNHEGAIIDRIQEAYFDGTEGIVINPGAYTHYSYAIHDALRSVPQIIKVEVHISDVNEREPFRQISYVGLYAEKRIIGQGLNGYLAAMDYLIEKYK